MMDSSAIPSQSAFLAKKSNLRLSLEEFSRKKTRLESLPSKIILNLTENCNHQCIMCFHSFHPKYKSPSPSLNLPLDKYHLIAKTLFPHAIEVDFSGFGEPTLHPHLESILEPLKDYPKTNWLMVTNLSMDNKRLWENMVEKGFHIGASIDAAEPRLYEKIRQGADFNLVRKNLEFLSERIQTLKKGKLYLTVTVQKKNIAHLPEIIHFANELGIREVQLKSVTQFKSPDFHFEAIPKNKIHELQTGLTQVMELSLLHNIKVTLNDVIMLKLVDPEKYIQASNLPVPLKSNFQSPDPGTDWPQLEKNVQERAKTVLYKKCFKPFSMVQVSIDGKISPCNHLYGPDFPVMGDLSQEEFSEIWNNPKYLDYRDKLLSGKPIDDRCRWCFSNSLVG